jgi:FKBP-type peptidyl-prolyl cis-trans isomerase SlpA
MPSTAHRVRPDSFLTLHYRLAGPGGDIINTFNGKPATLTLGTGELAPAVESHLIGLQEGAHATFEIGPGAAFGDRNPQMVQWVGRGLLDQMGASDQNYEVGEVVQFSTPDGRGRFAAAVRDVDRVGDKDGGSGAVLFDFNHPLAGQPLTFEVRVIGIL